MLFDRHAALTTVVRLLLSDETVQHVIHRLKEEIGNAAEPFIWHCIDPADYQQLLPIDIRSIWIFVLKKDVPSIEHFHPNSTQYTVMVEGKGRVKLAGEFTPLRNFEEDTTSWLVIPPHTNHEFYPEGDDIVVISFHTVPADQLIEIQCNSGAARSYVTGQTM